MPVLVEPDPTSLSSLLTALPEGSHGVDSIDRLHAWLGEHTEEYVVVLGPHLDLDHALATCESLRVGRPTISVLLVRDPADAPIDAPLLTRAIKAGARDVVPDDDLDAVAGAVGRAHQLYVALRGPAGASRRGKVITVFSPKGGVGKTTMAVNLALALADRGARQVCLVDLDLAFGDVAITLQLFPTHTIEHAIGSEESLDASLVTSLLTRHQDSLMVLPAPSRPDVRERVTPALVTRLLATLRESFDVVVVDTAPAFDEPTLAALDETDECVVVATLDVPTLKNVRVAVETLEMLGIARGHRHLLLNRADDAVGIGPEKVESILGLAVAARVATSIDIAAATNAGTPIVSGKPDHPSSTAIRALAVRLCGEPAAPVTAPDTETVTERSARRFWVRR
ncbi:MULTISPECIES: AAA family ATPase [unclassified Nocardioides]|uniref:AAA family ATPase n=1 Tax=unclassified Nocardioides TaxID=2615069 RepID=UPI0009F0CC9B|nr:MULTISPECIES: AAA family ATPase [unclassified Nocardioides]GAW52479.1 Flp pilus assembly protein ATPase CpaE-like [Nocardioides sp. PD653-B2]GAW54660.1 Flp pilus assembly protein ATPase CpaE-like [Nocardioides sp. PD653]